MFCELDNAWKSNEAVCPVGNKRPQVSAVNGVGHWSYRTALILTDLMTITTRYMTTSAILIYVYEIMQKNNRKIFKFTLKIESSFKNNALADHYLGMMYLSSYLDVLYLYDC